ncbi:MAG: peptidoglycan DD-metalloendopeptidase family protein [Patescibacteria group bacterium]
MRNWRKIFFALVISTLIFNQGGAFVSAEDAVVEIQDINDEISVRQLKIDQINSQIDAYKTKISQAESKQITLSNEIELLDNRVAQTQLEMEASTEEINNLDAEMRITDTEIVEAESALAREREMIASVLREIRSTDDTSVVEWLLGSDSFSDLSGRVENLETVHENLNQTLDEVVTTKNSLQSFKSEQEARLVSLEDLQKELEQKSLLLENQMNAKTTLIAQAAASEAEFQEILNDLLAEEQYINRQISALQYDIEEKLKTGDSLGDSSVLSWPFVPAKGLSATFHDPTYPFRHLFEHPGIDLPIPVGTPVGSAAPGYVAWVRQGVSYGNYVLVIHANGIATLYAHLSKILVEADQFVSRGEAIGLSGGRPGMPGAGLSTGPHLHFEVRKDGIPTNPLDYLVNN